MWVESLDPQPCIVNTARIVSIKVEKTEEQFEVRAYQAGTGHHHWLLFKGTAESCTSYLTALEAKLNHDNVPAVR